MSSSIENFEKWFNNISVTDQDKVVTYVLEKRGIGPMMEGLFSGPGGKVQGGVYSGPAASSLRNSCPTCKRPI